MTLTKLLGIERGWIRPDEIAGLELGEEIWFERGRPSEPADLGACLEEIIRRAGKRGLRYPSVLLLRKRQIGRGQWRPPAIPKVARLDSACAKCRGGGLVLQEGGKCGTFCECPAGELLKFPRARPRG